MSCMKPTKKKAPRSRACVPDREKWLWENRAALASVRRGLMQSAAGRAKPLRLDGKRS